MRDIAWDNVAIYAIVFIYALVLAPILGITPWPAVVLGAVWAYADRR